MTSWPTLTGEIAIDRALIAIARLAEQVASGKATVEPTSELELEMERVAAVVDFEGAQGVDHDREAAGNGGDATVGCQ